MLSFTYWTSDARDDEFRDAATIAHGHRAILSAADGSAGSQASSRPFGHSWAVRGAPADAARVRVVLAVKDVEFVQRLRAGLEADGRIEVVGAARTTDELVDLVDVLAPDVALIDFELGPTGARDAIRQVAGTDASTVVLVLVGGGALRDAVGVGAAGYLRKDSPLDGLRASFFEVAVLARVLGRESSSPADRS
jgi:ActR/RegA family two-component response regulator